MEHGPNCELACVTEKFHERLRLANAMADAAKVILDSFQRMRIDHNAKLIEGQTFESACANWDSLVQEPLEFGPLLQTVQAYEKAKKE